jgi:hypothetical protein
MGMFHEGFKGLPSTPQYDRRKGHSESVFAAEQDRHEIASLIEKYATALQNAVDFTRDSYFDPGEIYFTTSSVCWRTEACSPECVKALSEFLEESDCPKYGQVDFISSNCKVILEGSDRELKVMAAVYESQGGEFIAALFINNKSEYHFFGISDQNKRVGEA